MVLAYLSYLLSNLFAVELRTCEVVHSMQYGIHFPFFFFLLKKSSRCASSLKKLIIDAVKKKIKCQVRFVFSLKVHNKNAAKHLSVYHIN